MLKKDECPVYKFVNVKNMVYKPPCDTCTQSGSAIAHCMEVAWNEVTARYRGEEK